MYQAHRLVQIIYAQSLCFALSWGLVYLFGHRLRRGHWLVSLAYLAVLEAGAFWLVDRFRGPAPAPAYWIPVGLIALVTVALAEHWNALGQACMASTLGLSTHFLAYVVQITTRSHLGPLSLFFSAVLLILQTLAVALLCAGSFEILDVLC